MSKRFLGVTLILLVGLAGCKTLTSRYYFDKGNQLFKDNKYEKAIAMYDRAIEADPGLTMAHFYRGSSYFTLYKPGIKDPKNDMRAEQAIVSFEKVLEIEPQNVNCLLSLADLYDKLGNEEKALVYYKKRIENNPQDPAGYYKLADFYSKHGKIDEAVKSYEQRIVLNPQDPEGYLYLANFYGSLPIPQFDKSIEQHLKRADLLKSDPAKLKEAYYSIAVVAWSKSYRTPDLTPQDRINALKIGYDAVDKAIAIDSEYPEPVIYKGLLLREEAKIQTNDAKKKEFIAQADQCRDKYQALKKKQKEAAAAAATSEE